MHWKNEILEMVRNEQFSDYEMSLIHYSEKHLTGTEKPGLVAGSS